MKANIGSELRETLEGVERQAPQLLSAGLNIKDCSWQDVLVQFQRAQDAANDSERKGKKFHHRIFREIGASAAVAIPAMDAFPDDLAILHGALAVIFSVCVSHQSAVDGFTSERQPD